MILSILAAPVTGLSQESKKLNLQQRIHITADSMMANQNHRYVIFSGHVIADYGATNIQADKLQAFYSDQPGDSEIGNGSVDKIIATGNVIIKYEGKTARCDQAVYVTTTDSLLLTGDDVRMESESSYISGNKITIYQSTGQILVDGNDTNRVNAVFQPEEQKTLSE